MLRKEERWNFVNIRIGNPFCTFIRIVSDMLINRSLRKVIVYHLVIIYALAVIRPILPVINDALAHLFFEHHHLETVHHSHGHQHVQSEMKIISLDIQNFNDSDKIKVLDTLDTHFKADENNIFSNFFLVIQTILFHIEFPSTVNLSLIKPPPEYNSFFS